MIVTTCDLTEQFVGALIAADPTAPVDTVAPGLLFDFEKTGGRFSAATPFVVHALGFVRRAASSELNAWDVLVDHRKRWGDIVYAGFFDPRAGLIRRGPRTPPMRLPAGFGLADARRVFGHVRAAVVLGDATKWLDCVLQREAA